MSSKAPHITVLLPAYNAAPYIEESVNSVLSQTYTDFELLIINDGSTDNTRELLEKYTDDRIRLIHQDNMGLVKTLNKGLELARGKYIARFDADDICYPDRLEKEYQFISANPDYILVGSEADYIDDGGKYIFTFKFENYDDEQIRNEGFASCPVIHSSVLFLKDAVIKAGGYSEKAITFEDHILWRNLSEYGKIHNLKEPLIKVRFNASSVTIDEKWRGKEFIELKKRSIQNGYVNNEDYEKLISILKSQDFSEYKAAAYHSMIGKKYLWNSYDAKQAREHLRIAMKTMPGKAEPYLLYLLSYMPEGFIKKLYRTVKKTSA